MAHSSLCIHSGLKSQEHLLLLQSDFPQVLHLHQLCWRPHISSQYDQLVPVFAGYRHTDLTRASFSRDSWLLVKVTVVGKELEILAKCQRGEKKLDNIQTESLNSKYLQTLGSFIRMLELNLWFNICSFQNSVFSLQSYSGTIKTHFSPLYQQRRSSWFAKLERRSNG